VDRGAADAVRQVVSGTIRVVNWFGTPKEHTEVVKGVVRDCYEQRRKRWLASLVSPERAERVLPRAELHAVGRNQRQALEVAGVCSSQEAATELRLLQFLLEQETGRPTGLITESFEQEAPDLEVLVAAVRSDCWGSTDYVSFLHGVLTQAPNVRVVGVALDANALANHMVNYALFTRQRASETCSSVQSPPPAKREPSMEASVARGQGSHAPALVYPKLVKVTTASTACTASDRSAWRARDGDRVPGVGEVSSATAESSHSPPEAYTATTESSHSPLEVNTNFVRVASTSTTGTASNLPVEGPSGSGDPACGEARSPGEIDADLGPTSSGSTVFSGNLPLGSISATVAGRIPSLASRGLTPPVLAESEVGLELREGRVAPSVGSPLQEGSWALASVNEEGAVNEEEAGRCREHREMVGAVVCSLARRLVFPFHGDGSMQQVLTDSRVIGVELRRSAGDRGRGGEPPLERLVEIVPV